MHVQCRLSMLLTDAAPIAFNLERERHRGIRCSRLIGIMSVVCSNQSAQS